MNALILTPWKDDRYGAASRAAMLTYADRIMEYDMGLCNEILSLLETCQKEVKEKLEKRNANLVNNQLENSDE